VRIVELTALAWGLRYYHYMIPARAPLFILVTEERSHSKLPYYLNFKGRGRLIAHHIFYSKTNYEIYGTMSSLIARIGSHPFLRSQQIIQKLKIRFLHF